MSEEKVELCLNEDCDSNHICFKPKGHKSPCYIPEQPSMTNQQQPWSGDGGERRKRSAFDEIVTPIILPEPKEENQPKIGEDVPEKIWGEFGLGQPTCPQCGNSKDNPREDSIERMLVCGDSFHARPEPKEENQPMKFHDCGDEMCQMCSKCKGCEGCECIPSTRCQGCDALAELLGSNLGANTKGVQVIRDLVDSLSTLRRELREIVEAGLPPLAEPYRQHPPVYSMIPPERRTKWKRKWKRMDEEDCEQHHYKHYEWECRKVFEELECRERLHHSLLERLAKLTEASA